MTDRVRSDEDEDCCYLVDPDSAQTVDQNISIIQINLCYIIAEGFFFIFSFFVGYILYFGLVRLRTIRLSARAGAHIE